MNRRDFEQLVIEALDGLPADIGRMLDNVEVTISSFPSPAQIERAGLPRGGMLFGLYEGVPQTRRTIHYGLVPPDKITIFQRPIEKVFNTPAAIRAQVRKTILHEIGHHFGLSEQRLRELGL